MATISKGTTLPTPTFTINRNLYHNSDDDDDNSSSSSTSSIHNNNNNNNSIGSTSVDSDSQAGSTSLSSSPASSPAPPRPRAHSNSPTHRNNRKVRWHDSEAPSPPSREFTRTPTATERHSENSELPSSPLLPQRSTTNNDNNNNNLLSETIQRELPLSSGATTAYVTVTGLPPRRVKSHNNNNDSNNYNGRWKDISFHNDSRDINSDQAAKRDWARSLQRCLLETETELQESRATAEARKREALVANNEVARLRELASSQERRIAELERNLAQTQFNPDSTNGIKTFSTTAIALAKEEINNAASLDGLSVSEIKQAVQCAVEALQLIEAELEEEKSQRIALEKENDTLRQRLFLSKNRGNSNNQSNRSFPCSEEVHAYTMAFMQGPMKRFLTEAKELEKKMKIFSTEDNL